MSFNQNNILSIIGMSFFTLVLTQCDQGKEKSAEKESKKVNIIKACQNEGFCKDAQKPMKAFICAEKLAHLDPQTKEQKQKAQKFQGSKCDIAHEKFEKYKLGKQNHDEHHDGHHDHDHDHE